MCGRFTLHAHQEKLSFIFGVEVDDVAPRYNIAPTQTVLAVACFDEKRTAFKPRWGARPSWSKDDKGAAVEAFLHERGLTLSAEKTAVTHLSEGFDFLGQNIRRYPNGKLLIKPSGKNTRAFFCKVRDIVRKNAGAATDALIRQLNPVIRGWANYHRHVVAKRIFSRVDYLIFRGIWKWARQRHPRKGARWV